jgi:hypothetical protein
LNEPYPYGLRTLNLKDIPLFPFTNLSASIRFRDEYVAMHKEVVSVFETLFHQRFSKGVVVTVNQASVRPNRFEIALNAICLPSDMSGKTVFLFFVLLQRILDAQPTLLCYDGGKAIGFDKSGVQIFDPDIASTEWHRYPYGTWVLIDSLFTESGNAAGTPLGGFRFPKFFVVFTTSPRPDRYQEWAKQQGAWTRTMRPWSCEEYSFVAYVVPFVNLL